MSNTNTTIKKYNLTLRSNNWSDDSQQLSVPGLVETSYTMVFPKPDYLQQYNGCNVRNSYNTEGVMHFTCGARPEVDLEITVVLWDGVAEGEDYEPPEPIGPSIFYNYIESVNNTQYIDLGMSLVDKTIEIKYQINSLPTLDNKYSSLYGAENSASPYAAYFLRAFNSSGTFLYEFYNGDYNNTSQIKQFGTPNTNVHTVKNTHKLNAQPVCIFDGVTQSLNLSSPNYFTSRTAYLFGVKKGADPGTLGNNCAGLRIYYVKIYDLSNNLTHSFLPCSYNGQIGLWEEINSVFYSNQGTGNFGIG